MVGRLAFSGRERSWVHNSTNENRIRKSTAAAELMNDAWVGPGWVADVNVSGLLLAL